MTMSQEDFKELEYRNSCVSEHYEDLDADKQRDYLKILLAEDILLVTFTKKNGDLREMYCTLQDEFVPEHKKYFSDKITRREATSEGREVLAVFDMEKSDWRSFRMDSIAALEIVREETLDFDFDKPLCDDADDDDTEYLPF
jgi:hypothetical protein